jgi:hypothetical protein
MNSNLYELYKHRFGRLHERKDSRIFFDKDQPVIAECKTEQLNFKAMVQNLSSEGLFISTKMPSSIGQEIAFTFNLPKSKKTIKATGLIVRKTDSGLGVQIKVVFRK